MRLLPTYLTLLALVAALALGLAGCSGGFAPTLPSPNGGEGEGDTAMSTVTPAQGGVEVLPSDLTKSSFKVTLDGAEATVRSAAYGASGGKLAISFIIDSTGSMSGTLEGVLSSIQAFGDSLTGREITWQGSEYGDASPADGINTWDFFGDEDQRTMFTPSTDLAAFKDWLGTLSARGGGDGPENPLKAMMEAKQTLTWPAGAARNFIVLTDIGAHERTDGSESTRPDGEPFSPYMGSEVLNAFRGWATVHAVSPDYSSSWGTAPPPAAQARPNSKLHPEVWVGEDGWDIRELADGGPPAYRTHRGTGGKWSEMPEGGVVDLTTLGIKEAIDNSYTLVYERPVSMSSAHVVITAKYGTETVVFDLGTVTF